MWVAYTQPASIHFIDEYFMSNEKPAMSALSQCLEGEIKDEVSEEGI